MSNELLQSGIGGVILASFSYMMKRQQQLIRKSQLVWERSIEQKIRSIEVIASRISIDVDYNKKKMDDYGLKLSIVLEGLAERSAEMAKLAVAFGGYVESSNKRVADIEGKVSEVVELSKTIRMIREKK